MASKSSREYFAWAYGKEAARLGWPREVPKAFKDHAADWLKGYDGEAEPA
ncbi:hypothetical protein MAUB1S_09731 [Mycolicibacterium aubagnense]